MKYTKWCVEVTEESYDAISKWRWKPFNSNEYSLSRTYCVCDRGCSTKDVVGYHYWTKPNGYEVISYQEFLNIINPRNEEEYYY